MKCKKYDYAGNLEYHLIIEEPGKEKREASVKVKSVSALKKVCNMLLPSGSKVDYTLKAGE